MIEVKHYGSGERVRTYECTPERQIELAYANIECVREELPSVNPQESCNVSDTNDGKMSKSPTDAKDVIWYSKRNYSEIVVEPQERSE